MVTDTPKLIEMFKVVADNALSRAALRGFSKKCKTDGSSRLEVALELFTGVREKACLGCSMRAKLLSGLFKSASVSFGISNDELKTAMKEPFWRRGFVNVIKGIGEFGVRTPFVPGAPFQIVWNVTRACNLRCKHCYEDAGLASNDELDTQQAHVVIDKLADMGVIVLAFSGGEPTIRKDILDLISHAHKRNMYAAVATNGLIFSDIDKVREFKDAGMEFAQISLDGLNPETHDSLRGVKGSFKKTVEGIKNCIKEGLFVEVAATVTRYNYHEIPSLIDFTESLGANWFMMYNFIPTGRGCSIADVDLTPLEREDLLKLFLEKMKNSRLQVLSTAPQYARVAIEDMSRMVKSGEGEECLYPTHFYNARLEGKLQALANFVGGCGAGRLYASLEPNGDIYPCVFFPHEPEVKVGNILSDDFEDIWAHSSLFEKLRNKDLLQDHCGSCEHRYVCGGCRARAYGYFNDLCAPDPGCIQNEDAYQKRMLPIRLAPQA